MKRTLFITLFLFALCGTCYAQQNGDPSAEETAKSVKILQDVFQYEIASDEQLHDAAMAILQLTQTGTPDAVPELKKFLKNELLNTMVRTALINMPNDSGITALRESLETLKGKPLAGVIESLGSVRDEKSVAPLIKLADDSDETVAQSAIYALGKIATQDAVKFLTERLRNKDSKNRETAANALLYAAEHLTATNKNHEALTVFGILSSYSEFPTVQSNAYFAMILFNEEMPVVKDDGSVTPIFVELLKQRGVLINPDKSQTNFKLIFALAKQLKQPKTSRVILENFGDYPIETKAALIEAIGNRKNDDDVVPQLIQFALGNELPLQIAAVKALGKIGGLRGIVVILNAISSPNQELSHAGKESLASLQGGNFNAAFLQLLDSQNKNIQYAAVYAIGKRRITEAKEKLQTLFNDKDQNLAASAYSAYAESADIQPPDLESLLTKFIHESVDSKYTAAQNKEMEAMKTMCVRMTKPNEAVAAIERVLDKEADALKNISSTKAFTFELLFLLGGGNAAKVVANAALSDDDFIRDKATEWLGNWTTPDVAPYLLELAGKFPAGSKYQVRTLRGYIRVIRQMGLPSEQKLEMSKKALALASREEDKKLAAETLERFANIAKTVPLFDGKTFENWEFRNEENAKWFRIENGAIVGGSLEKPIPRNEFITTKKEYGDFTLRLEAKVIGEGANAGVQLRSQRLPQESNSPNEVSGYQADMTSKYNYWGCLYDESRRNKFLAEANAETVKAVFRENDWNELEIICKGGTIKISLNGVPTIEYQEPDATIPRKGVIGLQIHAAGPSEAWYRNIRIEED